MVESNSNLVESSQADIARSVFSFKSSFVLLSVLTMGYAVYAADRTVLSSVLVPLSSSLSLTNSEIGLLSAAQYIGVTCVVFLAGSISDRYGRWQVILAGLVIFSAFTWLIGLSTNFAETFTFRFVSGLGEGAFWPVAMASVATYFKARKGLALGIFYLGFDAGSVAGLSVGGIAYSLSDSWRPAFFLAPLLGIFVVAGVVVVRRTLVLSGERGIVQNKWSDIFQLLRRPNMALLMIFALLATWSSVWQVAFLPYYFFKVMHYTVLSSALLTSLVSIAGGFGKVGLGGFSDSIRRKNLLLVISVATFISYALFFFASYNFALDLACALSMGFFSASIFPVMQALVADNSRGKTGSALGLSTSFQSAATIFSPIIAALLFTIGVGKAAALDAMLPIGFAILIVLFVRNSGNDGIKN